MVGRTEGLEAVRIMVPPALILLNVRCCSDMVGKGLWPAFTMVWTEKGSELETDGKVIGGK